MEESKKAEMKANSNHVAITENHLHQETCKYCPIKDGYCNDNCIAWEKGCVFVDGFKALLSEVFLFKMIREMKKRE